MRLEETEEVAETNSKATAILKDLLAKGSITQQADGTIVVPGAPNVIRNANEEMQ